MTIARDIVIATAALVVGTVAATHFAQTERAQAQAPLPSAVGRYQILYSPRQERTTYLLDTLTGRVWSPVTFTNLNGEPTVWRAMERVDDDAGELRVATRYGQKETPVAR